MYGLRVLGEHGIAQIDGQYRNMVLINKKQLTIPAYTGSQFLPLPSDVRYTRLRQDSIIAVRKLSHFGTAANLSIGIWETDLVDSNGNHGDSFVAIQGANTTAMDVVVYEFAFSNYDISGYGLIVRNDANQVVFSSNNKPMRVVGSSRSDNTDMALRPKIILPSGRDYAIAMPERLHETANVGGLRTDSWGTFNQEFQGNSTVFSQNYFAIKVNGTTSQTYRSYMQNIMAIDVTNY